jgi:hypothetical protein
MAGGVYPMDHSMQYGKCNFSCHGVCLESPSLRFGLLVNLVSNLLSVWSPSASQLAWPDFSSMKWPVFCDRGTLGHSSSRSQRIEQIVAIAPDSSILALAGDSGGARNPGVELNGVRGVSPPKLSRLDCGFPDRWPGPSTATQLI